MIEKLKASFKEYYPYVYELRDVRVTGLLVFGIVVLLISWSGVKSIDTNYKLQREIAELKQQNQVFELDNANAKLENNYFTSNQFLELSARQNLGLAMPGETELIVPKETALRYTVTPPEDQAKITKASSKQPAYQRNFQAWVNFFLHRQNQS